MDPQNPDQPDQPEQPDQLDQLGQLGQLRRQIRLDTQAMRTIGEERTGLRRQILALSGQLKAVTARRERTILAARTLGGTPVDLGADAGLSPGRIRQVAPITGATSTTSTTSTPPGEQGKPPVWEDYSPEETLALADQEDRRIAAREHRAPAPAVTRVPARDVPAPPHAPVIGPTGGGKTFGFTAPPAPARPAPTTAKLPPLPGVFTIAARVAQASIIAAGDAEVATALLVGSAIPDAMALLDATRAGAVYDYTAHPSIPEPLIRPGKKQADQIWEARPNFTHPATLPGTAVDVLDLNGAYLAALTRTHLPIGRLMEDPPETEFNRKRSGIYLIAPARWPHKDRPNPLGDGREQKGEVWITDATLRLLIRTAVDYRTAAPRVLRSFTSGCSENLLTKFGQTLAAARRQALADGDSVTVDYVKAIYSKFISTAGDSRANHDLARPEWVHAIRSQAYANLWYKAEKARVAGLHVHKMAGTDELHIAGDWRTASYRTIRPPQQDRLLFPEGRDLAQVKTKGAYVVGSARD